jgi:hypothetical protein
MAPFDMIQVKKVNLILSFHQKIYMNFEDL